jgi:ferritin-like metal-binding protein YciE
VAKVETLYELLVEELEDVYSAERQLLSALPSFAEGASSVELGRALQRHQSETEGHVTRLERIFHELQESPRGRTCRAMEALLEEGKTLLYRDGDEDVIDAALIAATQRVEHFEIAAYGSASAHARAIGYEHIARLLETTLEEVQATDRTLSHLAEGGLNAIVGAGDDRAPDRTYP